MGLKQEALATALDVSQTSISRWESGAHVPETQIQHDALACLASARTNDAALKRLVESASLCVHLVDEASHVCLAYSKRRAKDWNSTDRGLLGMSLWRFATEEIRLAESQLEDHGWWNDVVPMPKTVMTSEAVFPEIKISEGGMLWERIYLADGTPARLVTAIGANA
ncbi:MAG: helix-turn-helix transcriptional regulator [Rhizobiales bacterium]|nr:helix-turn-helix transcriptional regulator [Hyphomicrobiales bacterium]MBO6699959.1 helix-turn-helix transcriptional regulator [Hyphomicrobiales bacterium]MBO6737876.1 helix-turn-helix transcriptional regulator [Hyphomicrobiales bacterium]MBO6913067.1 helix-turn-helix transcriptional regulator [Hyphomicrobiales bacterium]MBO6956655.1 helix-turn-helix transcriptional regulator [Hyphomicrobiales bacterium]